MPGWSASAVCGECAIRLGAGRCCAIAPSARHSHAGSRTPASRPFGAGPAPRQNAAELQQQDGDHVDEQQAERDGQQYGFSGVAVWAS